MATYPVILAPRARADLARLLNDLALAAGGRTAERYLGKFQALFDALEEFPYSGFPRPRLGIGIRARVVRPYVVFNLVRNEVASVARILHGARKITRDLLVE